MLQAHVHLEPNVCAGVPNVHPGLGPLSSGVLPGKDARPHRTLGMPAQGTCPVHSAPGPLFLHSTRTLCHPPNLAAEELAAEELAGTREQANAGEAAMHGNKRLCYGKVCEREKLIRA